MTEWLILALLVPAIVVPVVLLVGFAGCDVVYRLERPPVASINTAEGTSGSAITLTWTFDGDPVTGFEFERMKLPEKTSDTFSVGSSKPYGYVDSDSGRGLVPGTTYLYRIRAVLLDGTDSAWSHPEPNVLATTLPFQTIFEWTPGERAASRDGPGWQGACLVQRIEPARLSGGGTVIKLTLRAGSSSNALIDRIYVSRAFPRENLPAGTDLYDSDNDLTPYPTMTQAVAMNSSVPLEPLTYNLDPSRPLLIAVDFNTASASAISAIDNVPPEQTSAFFKLTAQDAAINDRTGFQQATAGILFIEKIEAA